MLMFIRNLLFGKPFSITIENKHMKGNYVNPEDCPLARALKEKFPNKFISVGTRSVAIGKKRFIFSEVMWNYDLYNLVKARENSSITLQLKPL